MKNVADRCWPRSPLPAPRFAQATPVGPVEDDRRQDQEGRSRWSASPRAAACCTGTHREAAATRTPSRTRVCDECTDDRKDKPIVGMTIIRGVKQAPTTRTSGKAATILDPEQRQGLHACALTPVDGGKKLEVRGYIGMPLLGRTQTWIRVE